MLPKQGGFSKAGEIHAMFSSAENLLLWSYYYPTSPEHLCTQCEQGELTLSTV